MHVAGLARRILAAERALVGLVGLQHRQEPPHLVLPETGPDHADEGEMIAAIDAGHQRAEFAVGGLPAAEHDLMSRAALCLGPALGAAGAIGRIELLGDDAFEREFAGRFQHGIAAALKMLDVADLLVLAFPRVQQFLQPPLALDQRQRAKILAIGEQQVERVEDQILGLAVGDRGLQRREVRRAVVIERDDLAVDHHVRQRAALPGDGGELFGPVEALAGFQGRLAILDAQLHAVAVELDLMAPAAPLGRAFDGGAELRRDEIRYCRDLFRPGAARRRSRRLATPPCVFARASAASPRLECQTASALALPPFAEHERLWRLALALRDLLHRSARGDRFILFQDIVGLTFLGEFVAVLDQKPVGALAAGAVAAASAPAPSCRAVCRHAG